MELRHLRCFVAVAEAGGMTRAADRLHVVQSALSHTIRNLEDELGHDLFERRGRRLRLSVVGEAFLTEARSVLLTADRAVDRARRVGTGREGVLRIGCQPVACCRSQVSQLLGRYRALAPDVDLRISTGFGAALIEQVRHHTLDAAFTFVIDPPADLEVVALAEDDWVLALPRDHRLSETAGIRLKDLVDEPFICFPREVAPVIHDRILAVAAAGGLKPRIAQEAYDETLMLNLVAAGMGIAFLARSCVRDYPGPVRFRTVVDFSLPQSFCFLSRPDRPPTLDGMRGLVLQSSAGSEATFAQSAPDSLPVERSRAVPSSRFQISEV